MDTLIGCSGWSYKDWIGSFYPKEVKKKEWLHYYGRFFPTVEINSTYYAMPNEYTVKAWVRKGKGLREQRSDRRFSFSLKMPKAVTHEALVKGEVEKALEHSGGFVKRVLEPLSGAGLTGAVLFQLSPYFRFDEDKGKGNLDALDRVLELVCSDEWDTALEFRHGTWTEKTGKYTARLIPEAKDLLIRHGAILCETDGPGFPRMEEGIGDGLYVRFHGRNYDIWFKKQDAGDQEQEDPKGRMNRYDYLYGEEELEPWSRRLANLGDGSGGGRLEEGGGRAYIYFNNHPRAKGPKNALMMMDMLDIEHEPKEIRMTAQQRLF